MSERINPSDTVCELCDRPSTHFCECEMCIEDEDGGKYLCDSCGLEGTEEEP